MMDNKEIKLEGNIALVGFEILEPTDLESIKKIVITSIKKLSETGSLNEMKLTLQQHLHGKSFKHEIIGLVFMDNKRFSAEVTGRNLLTAVSEVCEKLFSEAKHKLKKEQRHDKKVFK